MTIIGAPFLTYIGAMLHPTRVLWHGSPWLFIGVHLVWPFLVAGLALMLVQLVSDIDEAPARITRLLVIPMVIAFTLYTTYSGVAIGAIVWEGNRFPIARREPISDLIDYLTTNTLATTLRITAELLWAACAITAAIALRRRVPRPALGLFVIGALEFGYHHERPYGAAGMAALLASVVWITLRERSTRGAHPVDTGTVA